MNRLILFGLLLGTTLPVFTQSVEVEIEQFIADVYEQFTGESELELDYDAFFEELMSLNRQPLNLNNTNREELTKLMFLSDIQIENLLYHLFKFGEMHNLFELQLVDGLDMTDIRRMLPFVTLGERTATSGPFYFRDLFSYGKNEMIVRFDLIPEKKGGYQRLDTGAYLGSPLYHHLKYRYQFNERIFLNLTAEKDAGEQFIGKNHTAYDFYGASFQLKEAGMLKNLVVGDFQAAFGQGLVLNQAFGRGKSSMTTHLINGNNGFKRSGSVNEYNFMRGAAASFQLKKWMLNAFYSNRKLDGNPEPEELSGLYNTGYHRTENELSKKRTVNQQFAGLNISYLQNFYQLGLTSTYLHLNRKLLPADYPYNRFYFRGNTQWVTGLNYRARFGKLVVFGETALTAEKGIASLNGLTISPVSRVKIALLQRYFAPEYNSIYASAFSEGSRVSNESGVYAGIEVLPFKKWKMSFYADSYRFPWLKYGVDAPSNGRDFLLHANYQHNRSLNMQWRLKFEQTRTTRSDDEHVTAIFSTHQKASLRYQIIMEHGNFFFRHTIDGNLLQQSSGELSYGLSAIQDISYSFTKIPLKIDFRYQYFDAISYDNRVYSFEKDVLYAFSAPSFSGLGSRYYLNLNYEINQDLSLYFKFAQVIYADERESTGTGNELIFGNRKTELKLLIRWRFRWE